MSRRARFNYEVAAAAAVLALLVALSVRWASGQDVYDGGYFVDDFAANTPTSTVPPTRTPTRTITPTATQTPTPFGCGQMTVTGRMFNSVGNPAANRRVSISITKSQVVNAGCTLHPSTVTYKTDSTGTLPAGVTVVKGSRISITLENGGPVCVIVPASGSTILIEDLLEEGCDRTPAS